MRFTDLSAARQESVITWDFEFCGFQSRESAIDFETELDSPDAYSEEDFTGDVYNNLTASIEYAKEEEEREAEREQYELCRAFATNDMGICEEEFEDIYNMIF